MKRLHDNEKLECIPAIIEALQETEQNWLRAVQSFYSKPSHERWIEASEYAKLLNEEIAKHIGAIAEATNNSTDTLIQMFKPDADISVWFSQTGSITAHLGKLYKYGTFNTSYWKAMEKAEKSQQLADKGE